MWPLRRSHKDEDVEEVPTVPSAFPLATTAWSLGSGSNIVCGTGQGVSISAIGRTTVFEYPRVDEMAHLRFVIEDSRSILEQTGEFDSLPYAESTWSRAVRFLSVEWTEFRKRTGQVMAIPDILPGPKGSIDLHWDTETFELLINVPADPKRKAILYGHAHGEAKIEYAFNPSKPDRGLVRWLAERMQSHTSKSPSLPPTQSFGS